MRKIGRVSKYHTYTHTNTSWSISHHRIQHNTVRGVPPRAVNIISFSLSVQSTETLPFPQSVEAFHPARSSRKHMVVRFMSSGRPVARSSRLYETQEKCEVCSVCAVLCVRGAWKENRHSHITHNTYMCVLSTCVLTLTPKPVWVFFPVSVCLSVCLSVAVSVSVSVSVSLSPSLPLSLITHTHSLSPCLLTCTEYERSRSPRTARAPSYIPPRPARSTAPATAPAPPSGGETRHTQPRR